MAHCYKKNCYWHIGLSLISLSSLSSIIYQLVYYLASEKWDFFEILYGNSNIACCCLSHSWIGNWDSRIDTCIYGGDCIYPPFHRFYYFKFNCAFRIFFLF